MVFSTHDKTVRMVEFAVLTALTVILQLLCSVLTFGQISITLSLVPVVIGAALFGPGGGAILGFILGAVNFISSFFNPVLLFLFQASPVAYIITCFGKTVLAGVVAGLLYRAFREKHRYIGVTLAALSAPIVNTGVFFLMMIAFFQKALVELFSLEAGSVAAFVITAFIGVNFLVEFGLNVVLCPAIARIIDVVRHTAKKNAREEVPADAENEDGEEDA
ncbi:MAG: ECF transporter S component [Clostridia bacterium]|nr:ECF transporter S component [Clostridia bacterium]MDY6184711.1 ECF transporter S component [Eubacteriales bacterium]